MSKQERLHKLIARAGFASRRKAEDLILQGRVEVNGKVISRVGVIVDPIKDIIKVDGQLITESEPKVYLYLILNKPPKVLTTLHDSRGRSTVADLIRRGVKERVYPVGRLDWDAEGLMLLTNDGEVANTLIHPRYKVPKTYLVKLRGVLNRLAIKKLESGVYLEDGKTLPAQIRVGKKNVKSFWISITIREGRNKQIKRMCRAVGYEVARIVRIRFGPLELGDLKPGEYRYLSSREIKFLKKVGVGSSK